MNKSVLIDMIIRALRSELKTYVHAANSSHEEATAEENRAENRYDTRGLEASYLAAGQANKVMELEDAIGAFEDLKAKSFDESTINVGALVELDQNGEKAFYFIGPNAGGTEITDGVHEVVVITPQSPLGTQLQGQQQGDRLELILAGAKQLIQIVNVC